MRKKRSFFNMIGSFSSYVFSMIFTFITQAMIVKILGIEYSGINGLFTNILTMLSIAELGIGTTIIYKLYNPLAEDDKESIKSWMNFYKVCYRFIAVFVLVIGLFLMPFVPAIIGKVDVNENLKLLYFISLMDTVLSYCMTYKRSLLYADQKNYIINLVHIGYTIFMNLTQILLLILFKNYILFLLVKIFYRVLENIILNIYVNVNYPYINEPYTNLDKAEKKDVFSRIKSMLLQKISYVVNKGIDNIIITTLLGITASGFYINYNTVVSAITAIIFQIVSSMTASVGNLLTENNKEKTYLFYKRINMFNSVLTCIGVVGFLCAMQPFVVIWIGNKYLLSLPVLISFAIYIYSDSSRRTMTIYKDSAGICKEDKYTYIVMALINLFCSIILCKLIGMSGVILGTAISYIYLILYSYPKYIFKPLFEQEKISYYLENFRYALLILISSIVSFAIVSIINFDNYFMQFIFNIVVSIGICLIVFISMFRKTDEFKYYFKIIKKLFKNLKFQK